MSSGKLGSLDLTTTNNTTLYSVPAATRSVANVSLCNRSSGTVRVRLAFSDTTTPGNEDWIEYDYPLLPNSSMERTGIVMDATNKYLVVRSDTANVISASAWGYEEAV